jgi:glycogen debranching enzyme
VSSPSGPEGRERRGLLPRFTLKDADTFLLADALGDVQAHDDGLFTGDTRILSRFELEVAAKQPSLLGAAISQDNTLFTSHLTNRPLPALGERVIPQGVIHIERSRFLWRGALHERLRLTNFSGEIAIVPINLTFEADFADIFEVQGHQRSKRGDTLEPELYPDGVRLRYRGLDELLRTTHLRFSTLPSALSARAAAFSFELEIEGVVEMFIEIGAGCDAAPSSQRFESALRALGQSVRARLNHGSSLSSSGRLFNEWVNKSRSDLVLLTTVLATGPYPDAGIPWFATQFGRDAIITALQTLWLNPALAAGVLRFLARTQAHEESAFRDAEPGKIMHETRRGEMASLREVPFAQYYGGVDTTPLFVMLAGAYEERTGDPQLVDEIWDNLLAAVAWIERRLDRSASGFLDYARGAESGLANQGWKDSHDSIFHADGRIPRGPIAVVEVQGYAYAALLAMATLAAARGKANESRTWHERAERLALSVEQRFWVPEMSFYALAIDGEGEPCKVRASNPGHLLFCGVPTRERAQLVAQKLLSDEFRTGWGIRTLAEGQARYNPMSYHNGAVWPHDSSLCAAGVARYFGSAQVVPLLSELFEAANHFGMQLPELFCGFDRRSGEGPTPYPVACLPQAWASGAVFMLLQACLGLRINGRRREVHADHPSLPVGIESIGLLDLSVGDGTVALTFRRTDEGVVVVPDRLASTNAQLIVHQGRPSHSCW